MVVRATAPDGPPVRVFLAAPFAQWLVRETGHLEPRWRHRLELLIEGLAARGAEVFSSHRDEAWGAALLEPAACTQRDFAAMRSTDVVCAVIGAPPSGGVMIELGWASALSKPVLMLVPKDSHLSPLVQGLAAVARVVEMPEPLAWSGRDVRAVVENVMKLGACGTPGLALSPDDLTR